MPKSLVQSSEFHPCSHCPAGSDCPFVDLEAESFCAFQQMMELRTFSRGVQVLRQGDRSHGLYVIRSGLLRLFHVDPNGKTASIGVAQPGHLVGLTEVITGASYHLSAETLEECVLEYLPRNRFVPFLFQTPPLAVSLLVRVSEEFENMLGTLCETTAKTVAPRQRLLFTLLDLGRIRGKSVEHGLCLQIPLTVQELASRIGLSRQWTSKLLQELISEGLVRRSGRRIVLTPAVLAEESAH